MLVFLLFKKESESDYMLTIETKELNISEELKKKVDINQSIKSRQFKKESLKP